MNLIEVNPKQVLVHHWSQQIADLRPFFQANQLTIPDVQVTLLDRKKEFATNKSGDDFQYGQPIAKDFPIELFVSKWINRFQHERDDHLAAPRTNSGLAWDGLELGQIPWAALKSAWQFAISIMPELLWRINPGQLWLSSGRCLQSLTNFTSICPHCRRSFVDDSIKDVPGWITANLKTDFYRLVKWCGGRGWLYEIRPCC